MTIPNKDPMVESVYKELEEAADLHSPDCCSNSDHGCDACMKEMDCCDNMRFLRTTLLRFKEEVEGEMIEKLDEIAFEQEDPDKVRLYLDWDKGRQLLSK